MKRSPLKRTTPMARAPKPMKRKAPLDRAVVNPDMSAAVAADALRRSKAAFSNIPPLTKRKRDPGLFGDAYLHFVASHPCCMAHLGGCWGDVVAHHHRKGEHRRVHKKTVPLCYQHHVVEWHQHGRVRPLTRRQTVVIIEAEIDRLNEEWRQTA